MSNDASRYPSENGGVQLAGPSAPPSRLRAPVEIAGAAPPRRPPPLRAPEPAGAAGTTGFAVVEQIVLGLGFVDHGVVGASAAALAGDVIAGIEA
jgi:hypothetical protein